MNLTVQPVRVATGVEDEEGCLVFVESRLVAVLVRLSGLHGSAAGHWFFEHGFGRLDGPAHPTFEDIDAARTWIAGRLDGARTVPRPLTNLPNAG